MAEYESPFTPWIYDIWNDVVFEKRDILSLQEKVAIMEDLYNQIFVDGKWLVGLDDAGLVGYTNANLAVEQRDWRRAHRFVKELLGHPDTSDYDMGILHAAVLDGMLDIQFGDFETGCNKILSLHVDPRARNMKFLITRSLLGSFCANSFGDGPADPHVIDLARVVAEEIIMNPTAFTLSESATYPEVLVFVESTYDGIRK